MKLDLKAAKEYRDKVAREKLSHAATKEGTLQQIVLHLIYQGSEEGVPYTLLESTMPKTDGIGREYDIPKRTQRIVRRLQALSLVSISGSRAWETRMLYTRRNVLEDYERMITRGIHPKPWEINVKKTDSINTNQ